MLTSRSLASGIWTSSSSRSKSAINPTGPMRLSELPVGRNSCVHWSLPFARFPSMDLAVEMQCLATLQGRHILSPYPTNRPRRAKTSGLRVKRGSGWFPQMRWTTISQVPRSRMALKASPPRWKAGRPVTANPFTVALQPGHFLQRTKKLLSSRHCIRVHQPWTKHASTNVRSSAKATLPLPRSTKA
ncbi:hypothetical protein EMPG_17435 [Blastomyces silverae]|uniref:Uncharacterized protein n=1 Tax=Blastomyces silverae TaxID=2060906 RepID=A0A0H1B6K7_9EURO|nr:hypothetical protein EMPG_17435 [Blastomyces silverae]